MKLTQIRYFETVYKYKSITEASAVLFITQPAITISIRELEKELGFQLLHRKGNRIFITEEGEAFHTLCRRFLQNYDDFEAAAKELSAHKTSELKVGIPPVLSSFLFQKLHPGFRQSFPGCKLHITEVQNKTGLEMLQAGEIDLMTGISESRRYPAFDAYLAGEYHLSLFAHREHPLSRLKTVSSRDLENIPFVIFARDSFHYEAIQRNYGKNHLDILLESNQVSTIKYMVRSNLAVTITYRQVFQDVADVKKVPLQEPIHANIFVFKRKEVFYSAAMRDYVDYLRRILNETHADGKSH